MTLLTHIFSKLPGVISSKILPLGMSSKNLTLGESSKAENFPSGDCAPNIRRLVQLTGEELTQIYSLRREPSIDASPTNWSRRYLRSLAFQASELKSGHTNFQEASTAVAEHGRQLMLEELDST